ncbi:MAG TPA: hypothetical protein VFK34_12800 [Marmoricola sp.]|jgi:hypothetical protein|nr:hypothetical protein [Marmoricola sp.]
MRGAPPGVGRTILSLVFLYELLVNALALLPGVQRLVRAAAPPGPPVVHHS